MKTPKELYREAHQLITKARESLKEEMTDDERSQVDQWLQQADKIEKQAKQLQQIMEREATLAKEAQEQADEKEEREKEQKAKENSGFNDAGDYMVALYNHSVRGRHDERMDALHFMEKRDLAGEVGASGGYLIPAQQESSILTVRDEASVLRRRAMVIPMRSRTIEWPTPDYSQGAAGVSAFAGGVQVYYTEENAAITESNASFKMVDLHARELAGYIEVPNSLLADSPISLQAYFAGPNSFGNALAAMEEYDSINGNGAGRPLGVLNSPAKIAVSRNTASDFKFVDAVTMLSKVLLSNEPMWHINQSVIPKLAQFTDGTNNIFVQNAADGIPNRLLGYPIKYTGRNPALGTAGDVLLTDWSYYLLGDRQRITMDADRSVKFKENQTAFRVIQRYDGQPWLQNTITLMDGSTTVSPYVSLS
jgi:HK97 family phage major capsid protein